MIRNAFAFVSAFALLSCETVITNELVIENKTPLLVVEGGVELYLDGTYNVEVKLSTTAPFLNQAAVPSVENAILEIISSTDTFALQHDGLGVYRSKELVPKTDIFYTLIIEWNGLTYTATDMLHAVPPIDSIYAVFEEESLITDEGYFVKLNSKDPLNIPNQYHYRVFKNGEYVMLPDPGNSRTLVITDEFFDGVNRIGINPNEEAAFEPGDLAVAEQMGISMAYYDFLYQIYQQTGNQGLSFTGNPPPASIRGNVITIEQGQPRALGFFHAAQVDRKEIQITP